MKITNTFIGGKMNVDIDQLLIPKGQYFNGLNIEVVNPENNGDNSTYADAGMLRNSLGNKIPLTPTGNALTIYDINNLPLVNARCLGTCISNDLNCIFFIISSDTEDLIVQYIDTPSVIPTGGVQGQAGAVSYVLRAPKPTVGGRYLNLDKNYIITGFNYFENFLMWTDNTNPPRMINLTRFKQYTQTNFAWNQDDVNVIVKPPTSAPTIVLSNDGTPKNEIKNKFLYFSYRYKYEDNRWSTFAPFSQVAFTPAAFAFNGQNVVSMYNVYNKVAITVATGDRQVTDIQFLFKDSEFSNIYIIETVNKLKPIVGVPVIPNNSFWTYPSFDNSKTYASLPSYELTRLFDNVPIRALAQDIVGSRLMYGNYTQFFNLRTTWNTPIIPNFTVQGISAALATDQYRPSLKTNIDYEFGLVYLDDYGRMSTPITSVTNTLHVSSRNAGRQNYVKLNINHYPPIWATKYRLYIKQNRQVYYNVFPSKVVASSEAGVSYYLLNPVDKDKIKEGDSVLLKANIFGVTGSTTEYLVLEVAYKDEGALQQSPINKAGLYFKIAKNSEANIPDNTVYSVEYTGTSTSPLWANIRLDTPVTYDSWISPYSANPSSYSPIIYYPGSVAALVLPNGAIPQTLDPAVAFYAHGNYSSKDLRYRLEYVGVVSGYHCFNYRLFDSQTNVNTIPVPFRNAATNAAVVAAIYDPTNVIGLGGIVFSSGMPVYVGDTWRLNLYAKTNGNTVGGNPINQLSCVVPLSNNIIRGGAEVRFGEIRDIHNVLAPVFYEQRITNEQSFISPATYPNIQEWFWESGAYLDFNQYGFDNTNRRYNNVFFRYGTPVLYPGSPSNVLNTRVITQQGSQYFAPSTPYEIVMLIGSTQGPHYLTFQTRWSIDMRFFKILFTEFPLVFEAYPANQRDPLFHECSEDIPIITTANKKYHSGYNTLGGSIQNQSNVQGAVVILNPGSTITTLNNVTFNCWSFYNGVELNRIGDIYNKPTTEWSPRVMIPVLDYGEQTVFAGLTYSGAFKSDSNINNLNSFNLSLANFKYLEKSFGSVQRIKSRDTDIVVMQQDQISKVLFGKNLLSDSTGGGDVVSIPEVLGTQIAYQGEFGISNNPESFAQWGDDMYFTDSQRGAVLRLNNQGLFDISKYGMKSFFNTSFKLQSETLKVGVFDPYYKRYILAETGIRKSQPPVYVQIVDGIAPPNAYAYAALNNNVLLAQ